MNDLPSLAKEGYRPKHSAENLANQGELYESLNQQTAPGNAPKRVATHRRDNIGGVKHKQFGRSYNSKNQKDRVLFVKLTPPKQDGEEQKEKIGCDPEIMPKQ